MKSNEITDLIVGFALLFLMIIVVAVGLDPLGLDYKYSAKEVKLHDEERLFLINYLRTDTGNGNIADIISFAEKDSEKFFQLQIATRQIFGFYMAGREEKDYIVKVKYPEQDYKIIDFKLKGEEAVIDKYKELKISGGIIKTSEERKYEIKLPSLNKGMIEIEMEM